MTTKHGKVRALTGSVLCLVAVLAATMVPAAAGERGRPATATYVNPVSRDFADTFADPAVIRAKDGYWYAYGTTDPLREGERRPHFIPMARSTDLVNWSYVGDALGPANWPTWAAPDAAFWAPDIRYLDGRYYLYYTVTQTTVTPEPNDNAIGVATAPSPTGPWTDSGAPVIAPRRGPGGGPGDFQWTFDPAQFTDTDGTKYLYYGSYYGGIFVTRLTADGLRRAGAPAMVAIDNRYEGAYVVHRGRYYYLFASSGNCCAGPTTGYTVFVGRATSPTGPFVDRQGVPLLTSRVGGTIVVTPNGNIWVGTGHNAVVTDLAGQDWLVYHAIDRRDPYLDEPFGINERPMLLDRLDWVHGWPTVRAGRWASQGPQLAPVTTSVLKAQARAAAGPVWRRQDGVWRAARTRPGRHGQCPTALARFGPAPAEVRAEADLRLPGGPGRGAVGLVAAWRGPGHHLTAWIDAGRRALVVEVVAGGRRLGARASPLPATFRYDTWHNLALELRGRLLHAEVTDARLHDPVAVVRALLPRGAGGPGQVGLAARCGPAEAANLSAARLYRPVTRTVPPPPVGRLDPAFSDEFNDGVLDPAWTWVRSPAGQETGGVFRWPVQAAELFGDINTASVLLRDPPAGTYTVETKVAIDLGVDTVRNYQQAGLVVYVHDDLFLRYSHVAIWNTRQTEYGKEQPVADRTSYGSMAVGPPADVTWLRLRHRIDPANGEHEFQAASSRDGGRWIWGGVWTLPAGTQPRIGIISHGLDPAIGSPAATAEFDYFRVYRS